MSFDVEEWFQTGAMRPFHPPESWHCLETGVASAVDRLLGILSRHRSRATFFFLGEVMDRCGSLASEVAAAGHEIASHGWGHLELTPSGGPAFEADLDRFDDSCARLGLSRPSGFRAPSFTMVADTAPWAVDALVSRGYSWDSSVFPIRRKGHGLPGAPCRPFLLEGSTRSILEIPVASVRLAGIAIPAGGGAWMRLFPGFLHRMLLRIAARGCSPPVVYSHPWEYHRPLGTGWSYPPIVTLRQSLNAGRVMVDRLERILAEFGTVALGDIAAREVGGCGGLTGKGPGDGPAL